MRSFREFFEPLEMYFFDDEGVDRIFLIRDLQERLGDHFVILRKIDLMVLDRGEGWGETEVGVFGKQGNYSQGRFRGGARRVFVKKIKGACAL